MDFIDKKMEFFREVLLASMHMGARLSHWQQLLLTTRRPDHLQDWYPKVAEWTRTVLLADDSKLYNDFKENGMWEKERILDYLLFTFYLLH